MRVYQESTWLHSRFVSRQSTFVEVYSIDIRFQCKLICKQCDSGPGVVHHQRNFKIMIISIMKSAEIKTKSADALLKMIIILSELRIVQFNGF